MQTTKFDFGDRVKIISYLDGSGDPIVGPEAEAFVGKYGTVSKVESAVNEVSVSVRLDNHTEDFPFYPAELEFVEKAEGVTRFSVACLWEDTVGDSGESPTTGELVTFAKAVLKRWGNNE